MELEDLIPIGLILFESLVGRRLTCTKGGSTPRKSCKERHDEVPQDAITEETYQAAEPPPVELLGPQVSRNPILGRALLAVAGATACAGLWVLFARIHTSTLLDYQRNVRPVIDPETGNIYPGILFNGAVFDPNALIPCWH